MTTALFVLFFIPSIYYALSATTSLVVLPPVLLINTSNLVTVNPIKLKATTVDVRITVKEHRKNNNVVYLSEFKAQRAGVPRSYPIELTGSFDETVQVIVDIDGKNSFTATRAVRPDVTVIHVHTQKSIYKAGEEVQIRALPLTQQGKIYNGPLEFILVNPNNFELTKRVLRADSAFVATTFQLPEHLFFGAWKVRARPVGYRFDDVTHEAVFDVSEYVLPPFKLYAHVEESDEASAKIRVEARYFYGAPVSGSLSIGCAPKGGKLTSLNQQHIARAQMTNGEWSENVFLHGCDRGQDGVQLLVEVRDIGQGNRATTTVTVDSLAASFVLIPLQPTFNAKSENIHVLVRGIDDSLTAADVEVKFACLGSSRISDFKTTVRIGSIATLQRPASWVECYVLLVEANRVLANGVVSRSKSVWIPDASAVPALNNSWIPTQSVKSSYDVGDVITFTVAKMDSRKLSYMVVCEERSIAAASQVRDDGFVSITVTPNMRGSCVLYVYSAQTLAAVDVLQLFVRQKCKGSARSSLATLHPSDTVQLSFEGPSNGWVLLSAIDDRLKSLAKAPGKEDFKVWPLSMFDSTARDYVLTNFFNSGQIGDALATVCKKAAAAYYSIYSDCPPKKRSPSGVSNYCLQQLLKECERDRTSSQPVVSMVCTPGRKDCVQSKIAGAGFAVSAADMSARGRGGPPMPDLFKAEQTPVRNFEVRKPQSDAEELQEDSELRVRSNFQQVWQFDAYYLGPTGTMSISVQSPDTIGGWFVSSLFWAPGQNQLCPAPKMLLHSKKDVFMDIDMPKNVYMNETISVKISVTALDPATEVKYSVCMSELSRKICADEGSFGQFGRPSYTRIVVSKNEPIDTKTFTMRFLAPGPSDLLFELRKEQSFPGKHHCEVGEIVDAVRLQLTIAKRAETEEHFKRLILDSSKPLAAVRLRDDVEEDSFASRAEVIEVHEYRSPSNPSSVVSEINVNVLDTDTVYSISIDISKFLPMLETDTRRRVRRGIIDFAPTFLSDVLKRASFELYHFKQLRRKGQDISAIEAADNKMGSLISDMLQFSDCTSKRACGFGQFSAPKHPGDRSIFLTTLATSLLCEASMDPQLVCGPLKYIEDFLKSNNFSQAIDLHEFVDLPRPIDREWFLRSLFLQITKDCSPYDCLSTKSWTPLLKAFYTIDDSEQLDERTTAALAFMGTNSTTEIMRIKMAQQIAHRESQADGLPLWTAGVPKPTSEKKFNYDDMLRLKRSKSGDVLVNALGILAFVSPDADRQRLDMDSLSLWLHEQQHDDGSFENALDTYFASRAVFEYRRKRVDLLSDEELKVKITCEGCEARTINVTESSSEIYLPTQIRRILLSTEGAGKVQATVRILATKRQRSRRQLGQDDYYPVRMTVVQQRVATTTILQTVCLEPLSPILQTVEITHGLYTGYSASVASVTPLNSTIKLLSEPTVSSFAVHFVLQGLAHRTNSCYNIGVSEPNYAHEPIHLAPVAIIARHPTNDVVGIALISHPDQKMPVRIKRSEVSHRRTLRGIVDESIDTVCFTGGTCSCAETSCGVKCGQCQRDTAASLKAIRNDPQLFGVYVEVVTSEHTKVDSAMYTKLTTKVLLSKSFGGLKTQNFVTGRGLVLWLRECNPRCLPTDRAQLVNKKFLLIGNVDAIALDMDGIQHYVLRDDDRLEANGQTCGPLANLIMLDY